MRTHAFIYNKILSSFSEHIAHSHIVKPSQLRSFFIKALETHQFGQIRHPDLIALIEKMWPDCMLVTASIPALDAAFGALFDERGDRIVYRDNAVLEYAEWCTHADPGMLAMWHLAQRIHALPYLQRADLRRIVRAQRPLFSPAPRPTEHYAENHVHLGGVHSECVAILAGALDEHCLMLDAPADAELLSDIRRLLLGWLYLPNMSGEPDMAAQDQQLWADALGHAWHSKPAHLAIWPLWADMAVAAGKEDEISPAWLRQQMARAWLAGELQQAWLWLWVLLWRYYLDSSARPQRRALLLYTAQRIMTLRRRMVMAGERGLGRFVRYYNENARWLGGDAERQRDSMRRIFAGAEDVAELKITHHAYRPAKIRALLADMAVLRGLPSLDNLQPLSASSWTWLRKDLERWHFCLHLIRSNKHRHAPHTLWQEGREIRRLLSQQAGWQLSQILGPGAHQDELGRFQPSHWLRGLDVAGDENDARIEVYAPMLRWLRQGLPALPTPLQCEPSVFHGFHLSVHTGEDYAHPASGMRHVDETVRFCQMRAGDRLGHALALGIEPSDWLARQDAARLPLDEYVDNLVWLWDYAVRLCGRLPMAAQIEPILARKIARWAPLLPWAQGCPDVRAHTLHQAWLLRGNDYSQWQRWQHAQLIDDEIRVAVPDLARLRRHSERDMNVPRTEDWGAWLYLQRHASLLGYASSDLRPPTLPMMTLKRTTSPLADAPADSWSSTAFSAPAAKPVYEDSYGDMELEFMYALQDALLDEYDQLGLSIEANPTSNVQIAQLDGYHAHPVFRWYPPDENTLAPGEKHNRFGLRRGPIRVSINTDDPGILPTTLRTEYALLREAARQHGVTRTTAQAWLTRLREYGLEVFHQQHRSVYSPDAEYPE